LIVERADGVIELHPLERQPRLLAWDRFVCPRCLGGFTLTAFEGGVVVLESLLPIADVYRPH
jgi:hypothetical protein